MITKAQAMNATHGDIFHHATAKNADKTPARCRVTGMCKVWKTRPDEFRLPVKHGMYDSFYITQDNAADWSA
jgi:hypothetical protein